MTPQEAGDTPARSQIPPRTEAVPESSPTPPEVLREQVARAICESDYLTPESADEGWVDWQELYLDRADAALAVIGQQGAAGYMLCRPHPAIPGGLIDDWDGTVHPTREAADAELAEAREQETFEYAVYEVRAAVSGGSDA